MSTAIERLVLNDQAKQNIIYDEHLLRYQLASQLVKNKVVLDVACGSGYGSRLLAQAQAQQVVGVDIDAKTVQQAQKKYPANNLQYITDSAETLQKLQSKSFDVVVSFETIEHLQNYQSYLQALRRVMKDDGTAIISTPNKTAFTEVNNPFHVKEFTEAELVLALRKIWTHVQICQQSNALASVITVNEEPALAHFSQEPQQALYFVAICSNAPLQVELGNVASLNPAALVRLYQHPGLKLANWLYKVLMAVRIIK
ncbi:MAG: class I SAM-dependent methyltransferase [bacterium]